MTRQRRFPWFTIGMLFSATALSFLDRQVLSTLAPRLMQQFHLSNTQYSHVLFLFQLSYTAMSALGGYLVDRFGVKRGLGVSLALWSVASAAHALARNAIDLGAARFVLGVGEGACFPAATRGVIDYADPEQRSFATGIAIGGSALGAVIAPPLTLQLVAHFGWRGAFVATGLLGLLWCGVWFSAVAPTQRKTAERVPTPLSALFTDRRLPWFLLARFLFDPVFYFYMFWIPQFLSQTRGLSLERIGNLFWLPFLCLGLSQIFSGRVTDRLALRKGRPAAVKMRMLLFAAVLTPVSWLAGTASNVTWAVVCMSLLLFVHGIWITNYLSLAADLFPKEHNAAVVGLTGTVGGVAGMLSTLVIGPTIDRWSFLPIFAVSGVLYPLAYLLVRVALRQPRDKAPQPSRPLERTTRMFKRLWRTRWTALLLTLLLTGASIAGAQEAFPTEEGMRAAFQLRARYSMTPNLTYLRASGYDAKLDIYQRIDTDRPMPTLIFIHGGGWIGLNKEYAIGAYLPRVMMGWNVVSVEYRMSPVALAPAAVEDCLCALRWIAAHAAERHFDLTRLVVAGESAGGHLAMTTGMIPEEAGLDRECPGVPLPKVAAVISWFGAGDMVKLLHQDNLPLGRDPAIAWFGSMPDREAVARKVSPEHYVRKNGPPVFLIAGTADPVLDYHQTLSMYAALQSVGERSTLHIVEGGSHGHFSPEEQVRIYNEIRIFLKDCHIDVSP